MKGMWKSNGVRGVSDCIISSLMLKRLINFTFTEYLLLLVF